MGTTTIDCRLQGIRFGVIWKSHRVDDESKILAFFQEAGVDGAKKIYDAYPRFEEIMGEELHDEFPDSEVEVAEKVAVAAQKLWQSWPRSGRSRCQPMARRLMPRSIQKQL